MEAQKNQGSSLVFFNLCVVRYIVLCCYSSTVIINNSKKDHAHDPQDDDDDSPLYHSLEKCSIPNHFLNIKKRDNHRMPGVSTCREGGHYTYCNMPSDSDSKDTWPSSSNLDPVAVVVVF
jgi:hypothetical protein